jgi:hypothetical protein
MAMSDFGPEAGIGDRLQSGDRMLPTSAEKLATTDLRRRPAGWRPHQRDRWEPPASYATFASDSLAMPKCGAPIGWL